MSTGSKKKEPRNICLSEVKASHSQRMWAKVSSSAAHLPCEGLLVSPIKWRCLLRVLCPVRRPITTLNCALLKDKSLVFAAGLGPEDFATLPNAGYPSRILSSYILPRDPQGWLRSIKLWYRTVSCRLVGDFFSSYPSMSRDPIQPHCVPGRDIIQCLLTLSYQWRRCFGGVKGYQSCLTVRANTHIFL